MADKLDFKKLYKDLYQPGKAPALIEVPPICYLMVDGQGAPEGEEYQQALGLLYSVTFTIKMSRIKGPALPGYVDFVLPALEGLWDQVPTGQMEERDTWRWTSMIRMPDYVTQGIFE